MIVFLNGDNRRKILSLGYHVLAWSGLIFLPYIMFYLDESRPMGIHIRNTITIAEYALLFYLNYLILIDKLLFEKKIVSFFALNILLIIIILFLNKEFIFHLFNSGHFSSERGLSPPGLRDNPNADNIPRMPIVRNIFIFKDILSMTIPVAISIAIKTTEKWLRSEAEKKEAINTNLNFELKQLHYQLQPHFFFNSLNNIYSLVETNPHKAQSAIHNLSKLMRYMLYDTKQDWVYLEQEINFMEKYVQLMKLRQHENTVIKYRFGEFINRKYRIAPLLLLPLIENAFKHGVSASQPSFICFSTEIEDDVLLFSCENSNFPKSYKDKSGSGIGMQNLKKRLELLYPDKHKFHYEVIEDVFLLHLEINMKK